MTQEVTEEGASAKEDVPAQNNSRRARGELFDWITYNFLLPVIPLFLAYLALPVGRNPAIVLERGEVFILTAALLASEIAVLLNIITDPAASSVKSLLSVTFLLEILSIVLFIAATSNYNATHPDATIAKGAVNAMSKVNNSARPELPFPSLTSGIVIIFSVVMLAVTVTIVRLRIRAQRRPTFAPVLESAPAPIPASGARLPAFSSHQTGEDTLFVSGIVHGLPSDGTIWLVYGLQNGPYFPAAQVSIGQHGTFAMNIYISMEQPPEIMFLYAVLADRLAGSVFMNSKITGLAILPSNVLILGVQPTTLMRSALIIAGHAIIFEGTMLPVILARVVPVACKYSS